MTIEHLLGMSVMSLQTGARLARICGAIVDPRTLAIAAFYVEGPRLIERPMVLHPNDIRELGEIGMIVDDADKLTSLDGLVRLQEVVDLGFNLIGLKVSDENGRKLGKISSYSVETTAYNVMQVYTEQSLFRSLGSSGSTIHRTQIISVDSTTMIVSSPSIHEAVRNSEETVAFFNPFRSKSQPENSPSPSASRIKS